MKNKIKVLFVYPNERHMSTIPPAVTLLSQLLKNNGHETDLFDTTFYNFDDDISRKLMQILKKHYKQGQFKTSMMMIFIIKN